jgi:tRNA-splicing ligase RtcB
MGYGFPIGGVAAFDIKKGLISPGGVGYDINCGVRLLATNLKKEEVYPKIKELLEELFKSVPSGVDAESRLKLDKKEMDKMLENGLDWAFEKGYANENDLKNCEEFGKMPADASKCSQKAKSRGNQQLGTLGAGNHFLEVQYVDELFEEKFGLKKGQVVIMIHCGSRGFGHQICTDFLRRIEKEMPEIVDKIPEHELAYAPAGSEIAEDYLKAMSAAANFAWVNRQVITHQTREVFSKIFGKTELRLIYDVSHNMAKIEKHDGKEFYVHRKGATRAFPGQPIFIPGSMGTASYVLVGTEESMQKTFGSTAHGAGRLLSRHAAKKKYLGENVKKELEKEKIYIKSASYRGVAEEAPGAYKDVEEVVEVSHETGIGKKVARLKPIGVIKG